VRFIKDKPRRDRLKGNRNKLLRTRIVAGLTQEMAVARYRDLIGPISLRTWKNWEKMENKTPPPGAFLACGDINLGET